MKKDLSKLTLAALTAIFLSGCASMSPGYTDISGPSPALAFTTLTDPKESIKWTGDRYLMMSLRSIDTYYFQVPDTGYNPGGAPAAVGTSGFVVETGTGDGLSTERPETVRGPYESRTGSYKIIQYRPGHSR